MNLVQDCICHALTHTQKAGNVVLLVPQNLRKEAMNIICATVPIGSRSGGSWKVGDTTYTVRGYADEIPSYAYRLMVCNGGHPLTNEESVNVQRWRAGAGSVVPFVGS